MRVSVGWWNTEENPRVIVVFNLGLSGLGRSGKERELPNFAGKVSKFRYFGTMSFCYMLISISVHTTY